MNSHIGKKYIGKLFNKIFKNHVFVKLTNVAEIHNGFKFTEGLNVDTIPFYPNDSCTAGGIYFTEFDKIELWIDYNDNNNDGTNVNEPMCYCRTITIPDDAQVYIEKDKVKADKIILGNRISISELNFKESNLVENGFMSPIAEEPTNEMHLSESYSPAVYDVYENWSAFELYKNQIGC